jgi:enoyl-CoA hydratase/carnithine racemase
MSFEHILLAEHDGIGTITLNVPQSRNALALPVIAELHRAFLQVGASSAQGLVLAANGPVFCSGHNFADMVDVDLQAARHVFDTCRAMMDALQSIPQPVIAKVHALATAGGCQLVATCDLAIASERAAFALPGGRGAHFCHTPLVAVARNLSRKHALELAMTGDPIDARTAAQWGLVNRCVPHDELDAAVDDLIRRASRGTQASKGLGKRTYYAQIGMPQSDAYEFASAVMADATITPEAQAQFAAFFASRRARA